MRLATFAVGVILILALIPGLTPGTHAESWRGFSTDYRGYIPHGVIRINNNTNLTDTAANNGWPGNGSAANPIIIDGYDIDASGYGAAIYIANTTLHFVIRNCTLRNAVFSGYYGVGAGIMLLNVSNGVIVNNEIENNQNHGVYIMDSSNILVEKNKMEGNGWGIMIFASSNVDVYGNTINNGTIGVSVDSNSQNNEVSNNTIYSNMYGVEISDSSNNLVHNNTIDGTGRGLYGIKIYNATSNTARNNTVMNNKWYGISLEKAASNYVIGNVVIRNARYGVSVDSDSSSNWIYENEFYFNHNSGGTYNESTVQAVDNGTANYWYSSENRGNYWYDWANNNDTNDPDRNGIINWPYHIDGTANAVDSYPLKNSSYEIPEMGTWIIIAIVISLLGIILRER